MPVTSASRPASSSRSTGRTVTFAATWWKPALTRSTGTPVSRDQPSRYAASCTPAALSSAPDGGGPVFQSMTS